MNRCLQLCLMAVLAATAHAQTVRPVQHVNGAVVSPTDFWAANSNAIASIAPTTTNAASLTVGTLDDARISTNVVRVFSTNTVTVGRLNLGQASIYYGGVSPDAFRVTILGTNLVTLTAESANFLPKISASNFEAVQGGDAVRVRSTGIAFGGVAAAATCTNLGLGPFATQTNLSASNISDFTNAVTAIIETNVAMTNARPVAWVAPPEATNSAGVAGQTAYAGNYIYVCVGTNQWRRALLGAWE